MQTPSDDQGAVPLLPGTAESSDVQTDNVSAVVRQGAACEQSDLSLPPIATSALATQDDTDKVWVGFYSLDPRSIPMERWLGCLGAFPLAILFTVGAYFAGEWWFLWRIPWLAYGLFGVVILIVLIWWGFVWPTIEFRRTRWRCDHIGLEIHRGVFWRRRISVPLSRIQHVDVSQGPLQRRYGLAKFTVYTAGTQHSSVELTNIAWETAQWLRDRLMNQPEVVDAV